MADSQRLLESSISRLSRGRRIGLAATTGLVARGFALVAQVIAVAIAVRALGAQGFALYVVIASLVSWIGLVGLGVAPGLTLGIARAAAVDDRAAESRLFVSAGLLMTAAAGLLVGCAAVLSASGWLEHLMTGWLGSAAGDASSALFWMTILIAAQLLVVVPEGAQLGLQVQYVSNVWAGIGSLAAIVTMVTIGGAVTSVTVFVLVSQGPQVVARALNGVMFVLGRRHLLRPSGLHFWQQVRPIVGSGIAFVGFQIASYLSLQVGLLILAATANVASVVLAGVIVRSLTLEVAGLALVTTPSWPAIANAVTHGELSWIRRMYNFIALGAFAYCGLIAVVIVIGLEPVIGIWTGTRPTDNAALRILLATYVVINGWAHVNAMTLVGLGALRFTSSVLIAEAILVVALQVLFIPVAGVTGYVGALAVGAITMSGWLLATRVRKELKQVTQR